MKKKISIIIPVYNEEKFIYKCISSILEFELPENVEVEIFVADGMSTDNTRQIIAENFSACKHLTVIDNPKRYQANGINKAFKQTTGDYIMRLDAHAIYPKDYLLRCYTVSEKTLADNTGGVFITLRGGDGFEAGVVQAITTHKFGVGDSSFRLDETEAFVDTVPYGFLRREIFDKIGHLDERLVRCQDYEFNRRILQDGGKIWMDSKIKINYYNQATLGKFYSKQFYKEAPYNPYMWYLAPYAFAVRHAITGVFAGGVIVGGLLSLLFEPIKYLFLGTLLLYFLLAFLSAIQQSVRFKQPLYIIILPFCFFLFHFIHGLGILVGLIKLLTNTSPVQKILEPWEGAGQYRAYPLKKN